MYMKKPRADVIFLQETHFRSENTPKFFNRDFPSMYHATNTLAKTKGVTTFISKCIPLEITASLIDTEGRYVFFKGSVWGGPLILAIINRPNSVQLGFFGDIATNSQAGILILSGDFNLALNPLENTYTGTSSMT